MNRSLIKIHVQPGARKTEVVGLYGEAIKMKVAATPERGLANDALIDFIAERLGVYKSAIKLVGGRTGRSKTIAIDGMSVEDARQKLLGDT